MATKLSNILIFAILITSSLFSQSNIPIKIGEVQTGSPVVTYQPIVNLENAIIQEIGFEINFETITIESLSNNYYLVAKGVDVNDNSACIAVKMNSDTQNNLFLCRGAEAVKYNCTGINCSKCEYNLDWPPTACVCKRGPGSCSFSSTEGNGILGHEQGFIEQYLY